MTKKTQQKPSQISLQTATIIAFATLIIGFVSGVALTVYKGLPDHSHGVAENQNSQMSLEVHTKALQEELSKNPENTEAWINLGHIYFDRNQPDLAIKAYEKALSQKPNNANVLTDLGVMYRRSGKPKIAIENFEKAISVDPKHETARFNKGIVLMHDLNDEEGALKAWEELLEINPLAMANNNQSVDQLVQHIKKKHDK